MKVKDIAQQLINKGHSVKIAKRADGGYRVIELDGVSFSSSSSKGNAAARRALHVKAISKKQKEHLKRQREKISAKTLTKKQTKVFNKLNKARDKYNKLPRVKKVTARKKAKREGFEKVKTAMKNSLIHSAGLAYEANIDTFIDRLNSYDEEFATVINYLEEHRNEIGDSALTSAYQYFYDYQNHRMSAKVASAAILNTLKASVAKFKGTYNSIKNIDK